LKISRPSLVILGVTLILAVAPSAASAMIIEAHSPVTLLLTDPNGNQFGCTSSTCSPFTHTNFIDTLPSSECDVGFPKIDLCLYLPPPPSPPDGVTNVVIPNPAPGVWHITYYGIGAGGTFTITGLSCSGKSGDDLDKLWNWYGSYDWNKGSKDVFDFSDFCSGSSVTILSGSVSSGGSGGAAFGVNTDGTLFLPPPVSTPEFPLGTLAMVSVLFVGFAVMRWLQKGYFVGP
jgi:hypothetical protein